jgi:hypothetical protein
VITNRSVTMLCESQETRDAVIKSGMEHGAAECYDKLAEMFASGEIREVQSGATSA